MLYIMAAEGRSNVLAIIIIIDEYTNRHNRYE